MPVDAAKQYFINTSGSDLSSFFETDLLKSVRNALQHRQPPSRILGRIKRRIPDTKTEEELSWSSSAVIWTVGGRLQRQWCFPRDEEEIRSVCWAYFDIKPPIHVTKNRMDEASQSLEDAFSKPSPSVFGPYGSAVRDAESRTIARATQEDNTKLDSGLRIVRSVCIVFRTHARLYSEDGNEYYVNIPFIVRQVWPLFPTGFALEEEPRIEPIPWAIPYLNPEIGLHSLSSPTGEVSPIGIAHRICRTSPHSAIIFQEDHPRPNKDLSTFSTIKAGEHVIFVHEYKFDAPQIIITVDTRLQMVHCYAYGRSPSEEPTLNGSINSGLEQPVNSTADLDALVAAYQSEGRSPRLTTEWLMQSGAIGSRWHHVAVDGSDNGLDLDQPLSIRMTSLHEQPLEEEEDIVGPEYWLQRLTSIPVDAETAEHWSDIVAVPFNQGGDHESCCSYALMIPHISSFRVVHIAWESDISLPRSSLTASFDVHPVPARSIASVQALRDEPVDLLIVQLDHSLVLRSGPQLYTLAMKHNGHGFEICSIHPADSDVPAQEYAIALHEVISAHGTEVEIRLLGGNIVHLSLDLTPRNRLVHEVLSCLRFAMSHSQFRALRYRYLNMWLGQGRPTTVEKEMDCLFITLFQILGDDGFSEGMLSKDSKSLDVLTGTASHRRLRYDAALVGFDIPQAQISKPSPPPLHPSAAPILLALHILGQSLKIDTKRASLLQFLVPAILRISIALAPEWAEYWSRQSSDAIEAWSMSDGHFNGQQLPVRPPDIIEHCLYGKMWVFLGDISSIFGIQVDADHGYPVSSPCTNLEDIGRMFVLIRGGTPGRNIQSVEALTSLMIERKWTRESLDSLPICLQIPIRESLRLLQISPKLSYPLETYELIDRPDLLELVQCNPVVDDYLGSSDRSKHDVIGSVEQVATHGGSGQILMPGNSGLLPKDLFTQIRWIDDRRIEEVELILQSSRIPVVKIQYTLPENEHEKEHSALVLRISERTLSLPPGRALFTYGCVNVATPDAYAIPKIELAVRIMPSNIVMLLEQAKLTSETKSWAEFHNGVAAGLRLSPHLSSIESSWVQFAKPSELTAEHAGFLFGLGLNGHLKHVDTWNTFSYLSPKHDHTSMAILLGLAASNVGSSSQYITSLIAVHTPALLPVRTVDINVSLLTQSAGLVALGLVFLGTGDRRLADIALREISRTDLMVPTHGVDNREAYTLAAAFAFGMIMVGKGSRTHGLADNAWLNRFRVMIHGDRKASIEPEGTRSFDVNITAPGACLALAMLYLKSGRSDVADIVSVPTTRVALNTVPPNLLLLRTLAKSLILWDEIQPTVDWVNSQYAPMKSFGGDGPNDAPTVNALDIASYNVIAGACMAMSLKYAGTASADAWKVVVFFYDILIRGVYANARTYEHSIRRQATRDAINVLSCAMAIIMAGSGYLDCLQRLRFAHGKYTTPNKFGMHMANHMAMGLLFLGGGRYTLGTSDAAICGLLIAFYPRFPLFGYDNRFHLQALRHLWVLAVEPRCLITRDIDSRKVIFLPVKLRVAEADFRIASLPLLAPTLTPDFTSIRSVRVDSPRYWPIFIDFQALPQMKDAFIRNQTLWVKRRRGYLGYFEDPHCTLSSFARSTGGAAGDTACLEVPELLKSQSHTSRDFGEFMSAFTEDDRATTFAERLCTDQTAHSTRKQREDAFISLERTWITFCQAAMMDCFAADTMDLLGVHLTAHSMRVQDFKGSSSAMSGNLADLTALSEWYGSANIRGPTLLRTQLIKSILLVGQSKVDALRHNSSFMTQLRHYANGRGIQETDPSARRALGRQLGFYLTHTNTPSATTLRSLKSLYIETVQAGLEKRLAPESMRSALMMVMKETVEKAFGLHWQWQAIMDIIICWRNG